MSLEQGEGDVWGDAKPQPHSEPPGQFSWSWDAHPLLRQVLGALYLRARPRFMALEALPFQ